jgi:hypothetical protein
MKPIMGYRCELARLLQSHVVWGTRFCFYYHFSDGISYGPYLTAGVARRNMRRHARELAKTKAEEATNAPSIS